MIRRPHVLALFAIASGVAGSPAGHASGLTYTYVDFQAVATSGGQTGNQYQCPDKPSQRKPKMATAYRSADLWRSGNDSSSADGFDLRHRRQRRRHESIRCHDGARQFRSHSEPACIRLLPRNERNLRSDRRAKPGQRRIRLRQLCRRKLRYARRRRRCSSWIPLEPARTARSIRLRALLTGRQGRPHDGRVRPRHQHGRRRHVVLFRDLAIGVDYATGETDSVAFAMRFSFGDLGLQR